MTSADADGVRRAGVRPCRSVRLRAAPCRRSPSVSAVAHGAAARHHPRPRRAAPRPGARRAASDRRRSRRPAARRRATSGSRALRRLPRDRRRAARSSRASRATRCMDQRNETFVPARAGHHDRHDRRFPEQRSHLPQRVLALEDARASISAATRAGHSKAVRFDSPGIVRVFCDIHSHMNAFILVFSHPFFAMTDADGRYRIDNVPPGTYNVVAWNEGRLVGPARGHRPRRRRRRARLLAAMTLLLLAAQPHLPRQRAAGGAVDRRRDLPRQRSASRARPRRRCSATSRATGALVDQLRTHARRDLHARWRALIADAPKLKAAVDTNDPPTVQDIVKRLPGAAQLEPAARHEHARAACWRRRRRRDAPVVAGDQPAVREALAGTRASSLLPQPDGILQLVTVPIAIGIDASRDPRHARASASCSTTRSPAQLKAITGSDIAFGMDGHVLADHAAARGSRGALGAAASAPTCRGASRSAARNTSRCRVRSPRPRRRRAGPAGPVALILRSRTEQLLLLQTHPHRPRRHRRRRGAAGDAPQLRGRAHDHASARGDHRRRCARSPPPAT